ncbi:uncharacterized protein LOC144875416 [Branchiostoma floridae x Branchiostoma japonicum]
MPVEVGLYKIPYRNMFCALCNSVVMTELSIQSYTVCSGQLNSSHKPVDEQQYSNVRSTLGVNDDIRGCLGAKKVEFGGFESDYARSCLSPMTGFSNANCDMTTCMSYIYPVFSRYKTYRNLHCALCEGLSLAATTHLRCGTFNSKGGRFSHEVSLTRLFNFDVDVSGLNQCPSGTLYDPFADTCREFSSTTTRRDLANKTTPLQNCSEPALTFTSEEFRVLPNGSVHLLSSNVSCPVEQVAILNTTASICGECILQHFSNHTQTTDSEDSLQGWLTLGLVTVSAVAVVIFFVHNVRSGQWEKVAEKLKVQMMTCMALAEVLFVVRLWIPHGPGCAAFAIILHYLFLTGFTSMNALAMDLFLTFRDGLERVKLYQYQMYTWLVPMLVVVMTVIVEFGSSVRVGYGEHCWIGDPTASLVAFGVPVFCTLLVNAVLITLVLVAIRKSFQIADAALKRSNSSKAWVYIRIFFLTGFTWLLGFIYPFANSQVVEYIFIVLNASQGLLMALMLSITSKVVEKWESAIRARLGLAVPQQNNGQTATTTAGNRQAATKRTEPTVGGTGSATDIPMTTFVDEEGKRRRRHLDKKRTTAASNQLATTRGAKAVAGVSDPGADKAIAAFSDVEKSARVQLNETHQDSGASATSTAGNRQATEGETGSDVDGNSTKDVAMATFADVEKQSSRVQLNETHQDSGASATSTAGNRQATEGETGSDVDSATNVAITIFTNAEEKRSARVQLNEPHQDSGAAATAANKQAVAMPTTTVADVEDKTPDGDDKTTCF